MSKYAVPEGYRPLFSVREIEKAIKCVKDHFEEVLAQHLNLQRVTAPLFLLKGTGLNDDLNGIEEPVHFYAKDLGREAEVVQSLAKWKRDALHRYGFPPGEGLYTDMNAIRPEETLSPIHSLYVDQWDWEKVMHRDERNVTFLQKTVIEIYEALRETERYVASCFSKVNTILPEKITFITSEELRHLYPEMAPRDRETAISREYGAVFIIGIGGELSDGVAHDGRAPDYDDWTTPREDGGFGLNGDILLWHPVLQRSFEISSMGIRVDANALRKQLEIRGCTERVKLPFHREVLDGVLPQTIGGGIGQSRLCMFFLRTCHVGEVSCCPWPEEMFKVYKDAGVNLL